MRNEKLLDVCCTQSIVMVIRYSRGQEGHVAQTEEDLNTSVGKRRKETKLQTAAQMARVSSNYCST